MYRIGHCPLCQTQIMVKNPDGSWSTYKPNFRQVDINFGDGSRVRSTICADCLEAGPDKEKLLEAILSPKSQACDSPVKKLIASKGAPENVAIAARAKQGISWRQEKKVK